MIRGSHDIAPTILVVDDEPANILILRRVFEELPCQVEAVNNGWQAIELCQKKEYALICLDILMPEINGLDTLIRIRSKVTNKETPVFFMTGMDMDPELLMRAYNAGAVDFIQKPFNLNILTRKSRFFINFFAQKEELKRARKESEMLLETRMSLIANITHDLRTPLFGMLGMIDILKKESLSCDQEEMVHKIEVNSENLLDTVNEFLDFTKTEKEGHIIHNEFFSLKKACDDMIDIMSFQYHKAESLELKFFYDREISEFVRADKKKIRHILINLLSNALKFTKEGFVSLEVRRIGQREKKNLIKFIVSDSGIGIPKEKQKEIFKEFSQVENDYQNVAMGTGLGLAICQKLVSTLGGNLKLRSEVGRGSTFYFTIPIEPGKESDLAEVKESYSLEELLGERILKVLIIDDVSDNLFVMKNYLNTVKIELTLCDDPLKANNVLRENYFDIILLDINMPEKNGFEVALEFQEDLRNGRSLCKEGSKLVALSAFDMSGDFKDNYEDAGFCDHIMKPVRKEKLYQKIVSFALDLSPAEESIKIGDVIPEATQEEDFDFSGLDQDFIEYMPTYLDNKMNEVKGVLRGLYEDDYEQAAALCHKILGTAKSFGLLKVDRLVSEVQSDIKSESKVLLKENSIKKMEEVKDCLENLCEKDWGELD